MEESKSIVEPLAVLGLLVLSEFIVFNIIEDLQHVLLERYWRLHGHLNTSLQNRHRELRCGHGGHPESEVRVVSFCELIYEYLESRHPRQTQMTVFQNDPISVHFAFLDHVLSCFLGSCTK